MKYFLFSTTDRASFKHCVEDNNFWGRDNRPKAFAHLNINQEDRVIFYCAEEKSFIADCEITTKPTRTEDFPELKEFSTVPVVIRLHKIKDLSIPLDKNNWKNLETFQNCKDREGVGSYLQGNPRGTLTFSDYSYITGEK